ncbi:MAG: peroxidase-related enzyme [Ignavibacteriales bacterium]|nr:peroxidase-related enzyme [Ignavibacteriales bacterium]
MAFIRMIPEEEARGPLKELYTSYRAPWGGVDNILKIHSLLPDTLKPHYDLYKSVMFGKGPLSRRQREMIAIVVSRSNNCTYCIHHHSDALLRVTKDRPLADALRAGDRSAPLSDVEHMMLEFAERLTKQPTKNFSFEVSRLKENGFTDDTILHITLIVGYFNFVNRIAIGLSVELESYWNKNGYSDPTKPMAHDKL